MVDSLQITRNASQNGLNGTGETLEITENGEIDFEIDKEDDESSENIEAVTLDECDGLNELPVPRTELRMPMFLQKKPALVTAAPPEKSQQSSKVGVEIICPNICFYFLQDECVEGDNCYYLHELPSDSAVTEALSVCDSAKIVKLFTVIIARCPKLLHQYFHVFIDVLAERNSKDDLIAVIDICERERDTTNRHRYFQQLIKAFMRTGDTYTMAMHTIFVNVTVMHCDLVDTLLNINLVDGIGVSEYLSVFRSLNEHRYRFNKNVIDRLMYLCTQSENALPTDKLCEFARLIYNILRTNRDANHWLNKDYYNSYNRLYSRIRNIH